MQRTTRYVQSCSALSPHPRDVCGRYSTQVSAKPELDYYRPMFCIVLNFNL